MAECTGFRHNLCKIEQILAGLCGLIYANCLDEWSRKKHPRMNEPTPL